MMQKEMHLFFTLLDFYLFEVIFLIRIPGFQII